ncbi:glycine cleavage system aminomethyltransferase GcvT [Thiospirillum jenense]|uniref:Aminomethyltransferase n=1 Tax=Thiospirillum jenense TaxID=1653858 RepID=A0A839H6I7_9GAMM|nr:glycine cleavage system aminomethyltransferase GcvT [Thiospirillum jenense]MBB1125383.1 glycine cleavage system aminomethyltransferase GcvT [Thiospirillum jenense]
MSALYRTELYPVHQQLGATFMPFGGWDMPLHYGSQLAEHHAVRTDAGLFDVSHMRAIDVDGDAAQLALRRLLANDIARLTTHGKALYSCLLNPAGGIVDDLIVYRQPAGNGYRLVLNAATAERDLNWMRSQITDLEVTFIQRPLALLALQGPNARAKAAAVLPAQLRDAALALPPFTATSADDLDWFIARTGYTGEDGFELMLPNTEAAAVWTQLIAAGFTPCGLGARDTLRLEAGMNLYGQDMDETTTPLDSGVAWTVAWQPTDRRFIGRAALEAQRASDHYRPFVGLLLLGRGIMRPGQVVTNHHQDSIGVITSGGFAPTLQRSIALARLINKTLTIGDPCHVIIRNTPVAARIVKPPFVRHGQAQIELN